MSRDVIDRPRTIDPPRRMSYDEYRHWNRGEGVRAEWVDGEVIVFTSASELHQALLFFLARLLADFVEVRNLGRVYIAGLELRLPSRPSAREPDILFVHRDHLDRIGPGGLDGPADLVVEIVSDDSVARDGRMKRAEYAAAGIPEYWILDPRPGRRRATFLQLGADQSYQVIRPDIDGRYRSAVVPGFWLDPAWLWQEPLPGAVALRAVIDAGR
jgi:Uma2 family endonuclease